MVAIFCLGTDGPTNENQYFKMEEQKDTKNLIF